MNDVTSIWLNYFDLSGTGAFWLPFTLIFIQFICVVLPATYFISYSRRKFSADLQARIGPNRVGPFGLGQSFADFLKLLQKNRPLHRTFAETLSFSLVFFILYSTLAILPLGSLILLLDAEMNAFIVFFAVLSLALGVMILGFSQEKISSWLGSLRFAAQSVSGLFPALISVLSAGLLAGGYRWLDFAEAQAFSPWTWLLFSTPFHPISFLVFLFSGMVFLNIPPFDSGVASLDIKGGISANLSGTRLILFRFGRFYVFLLWVLIAVTLFLGGWNLPLFLQDPSFVQDHPIGVTFAQLAVVLLKSWFLVFLLFWFSEVSTKLRADQTTGLAWKILSPLSLICLMGSSLWLGARALL
jgi:NADH-quinone oxidoreductase subunit H